MQWVYILIHIFCMSERNLYIKYKVIVQDKNQMISKSCVGSLCNNIWMIYWLFILLNFKGHIWNIHRWLCNTKKLLL